MVVTDKLTGIFNRQAFDVVLNQTIKEAMRKKFDFSIIMFDIDFFKRINDTYGDLCGDNVIVNITQTVLTIIRKSDVICRWGGEEFVILLKDCNIDDAFNMSKKIRKAISEKPVIHEDKEINVAVSLGLTQYIESDDNISIVRRAGRALYSAKNNGRNMTEKGV